MMRIANLGLAVFLLAGSAAGGPVIYLFDGDSSFGAIVDIGTGATTFGTFGLGYPVAIVGGTIRLHDRSDDDPGGVEYDLNGVPTGVTWAGGGVTSADQMLDGTTDGTFNYAVQCCSDPNGVWRGDLYWGGLTKIFDLPTSGSGITYDPALDSLWVTTFDAELLQYDMAGTLLNTFSVSQTIAALSYDPATDTLWGHGNGSDQIFQLSKTGSILNTYNVPEINNRNIWGGEIAAAEIPEPASLALAAFGLMALGLACAKRR